MQLLKAGDMSVAFCVSLNLLCFVHSDDMGRGGQWAGVLFSLCYLFEASSIAAPASIPRSDDLRLEQSSGSSSPCCCRVSIVLHALCNVKFEYCFQHSDSWLRVLRLIACPGCWRIGAASTSWHYVCW